MLLSVWPRHENRIRQLGACPVFLEDHAWVEHMSLGIHPRGRLSFGFPSKPSKKGILELLTFFSVEAVDNPCWRLHIQPTCLAFWGPQHISWLRPIIKTGTSTSHRDITSRRSSTLSRWISAPFQKEKSVSPLYKPPLKQVHNPLTSAPFRPFPSSPAPGAVWQMAKMAKANHQFALQHSSYSFKRFELRTVVQHLEPEIKTQLAVKLREFTTLPGKRHAPVRISSHFKLICAEFPKSDCQKCGCRSLESVSG